MNTMFPHLPHYVSITRKVPSDPTYAFDAFDVIELLKPQVEQWVEDNCRGSIVGCTVDVLKDIPVLEGWFEHEDDAVLFRMRWQ